MASEKVGAHTLGPIEAHLKKGTYASDAAAAARKLGLLHQVVDTPKVWKETKERATGLIRDIQAASERAEAPAAAAAAPAPAVTVASAAKPTTLDRLSGYSIKYETGYYRTHPEEIDGDIAALRKMGDSMEKAKEEGHAAKIQTLIKNIETQRHPVLAAMAAYNSGAAAAPEERREPPVSAPAVAAENKPVSNSFAAVAARPHGGIAAEMREGEEALAAVANFEAGILAAAAATAAPAIGNLEKRRELPLSAPAAANLEKKRSAEPEVPPAQQLAEKIQALDLKLAECAKECKAISDEKKALEEFARNTEIAGISLPASSKLFDLLRDRILDPAEDWATRLETLINIPHSSSGAAYLRGGDYFEALFQIAIAIGELPIFRDKFVRFYDIEDYKVLKPYDNYLYKKTVQNSGGGEQGISDITFEVSNTPEFTWKQSSSYKCGVSPIEDNITSNPFYFISVKGFKKEKSPAKEYDIPLLNLQLSVFPETIPNKHIIVCVRNKAKLLEKLSRTKMDMLKHSINRVIGYDDLIEVFTAFRLKIFTKLGTATPTQPEVDALLRSLYPENKVVKPMLSLYFHQELVVNSVMDRIHAAEVDPRSPHYLCIGVLPRGGKSFIAGGIINQHKAIGPASAARSGYNVLFLTSAVNETRSQFREDLINKFSEFNDFQFVDLVKRDALDSRPNKFYFMSRQLSTFSAEDGEPHSILATLERYGALPSFDICFFDEAHVGIRSARVHENFDAIFSRFAGIPIVLMTATYKNPSVVLRSNKDLFVWDLQDIKDMKGLPTLGLDEFIRSRPDVLLRYHPYAEGLLKRRISLGESLEALAKPYLQFANPNFISLTFTERAIQDMIFTGAGYDHMNAFEINPDESLLREVARSHDWWRLLRNSGEASQRLLQFLTPESEDMDGLPRKYRALNQIFRIAQKNGSRPINGSPFSILMFLPFRDAAVGKNAILIGELCRIWASFMRTQRYWREKFVFLTLSAYAPHIRIVKSLEDQVKSGIVHRDDHPGEDLKKLIIHVEKEALKQDKGLVILSGNVAKMGISLPCVDVVFMMGNNPDADDIIQKMYRALTDDPPLKKDGFIVDLDLKRVVKAMFDYDLEKDKLRTTVTDAKLPTVDERLMRLFDLCNWGQESIVEENASFTFDDVMQRIKDTVVKSLGEEIRRENTVETIQKKQELMFSEEFIREMQNELSGTVKAKAKSGRASSAFAMSRSESIPRPAAAAALGGAGSGPGSGDAGESEDASGLPPPPPPPPPLDVPAAKKRMFEIIQTFINTLVIRSAESWSSSSMKNLAALLEIYWADKATTTTQPVCECTGVEECTTVYKNADGNTIHKNIYELIYCELKAFAYEIVGTNTIFNAGKHAKIMELAERQLRTPLIEWNIYIETLLKDLRAQAGGSRYRVTRRRKTAGHYKGYGVRKTLQQRSKYNR